MAEVKPNKATITALGDAFVLTAGFKYETVKNLIKYGKENALTLVDPETKDPYFRVSVGTEAEASKYGVVFTGANKQGFAECTGSFPSIGMSEEKKAAYLRDYYALVLANLNEVQAQVETAAKELDKIMELVDSSIEIK